jgi:hypothetical protein
MSAAPFVSNDPAATRLPLAAEQHRDAYKWSSIGAPSLGRFAGDVHFGEGDDEKWTKAELIMMSDGTFTMTDEHGEHDEVRGEMPATIHTVKGHWIAGVGEKAKVKFIISDSATVGDDDHPPHAKEPVSFEVPLRSLIDGRSFMTPFSNIALEGKLETDTLAPGFFASG